MAEYGIEARHWMVEGMLARSLWLGLYRGLGTDEETDPAYARQPIRFAGDRALFQNAETVTFPPRATDATESLRSWFVADAAEGGTRLWWEELARPRMLMAREQVFFEPGDITVDNRPGGA